MHPPSIIINGKMNMDNNSPVEALALNYLSFGFLTLLNNFWTWLAFSFWKVRSTHPELLPPSTSDESPDPVLEESDPDDALSLSARPIAAASSNGGVDVDVDGVTKGKLKFTLRYNYEDYDDDTTENCKSGDGAITEEEEEEWWKRLLRMRRGEFENGWYTCQDLTVINGNVVRFWDCAATT